MIDRLVPAALVALALAVSMLGAGAPARAQSIGLAPGSIEVEEALRGSEYTREFRVVNQRTDTQTYSFNVEGEAASWMTLFDANDRTLPVDSVVSQAEEGAAVIVKIAIPDDAANGRYVTEISLGQFIEGDDGEPGQVVTSGLALDVVIDVTGTQRLEGQISDVQVRDTEVGLPLRVQLDFENTGNVTAEPEVLLVILNSVGEIVGVVEKLHDAVSIESSATLQTEWDVARHPPAVYNVGVIVSLADEDIYAEPFDVQVWPEGHFTRQGRLEELAVEISPNPGGVAKLNAVFFNSGEVDTQAFFLGEVYRDDILIDTATSAELFIDVGQRAQLDIFVPTEERGEYRVEGLVNFEGKETNSASLVFKVPPDFGSSGIFGRPWWQVVGGAMVVAIVLYAGAVEGRRRWKELNQ